MILRLLSLLVAVSTASANAQAPRHLFLDPAFVEEFENVALRVNPPQQREIVIRADKPWEQLMISLFLTVLDEGDMLRMWYICRDRNNRPNLAYAESADGVSWTKPNLGIVDYEGSESVNMVFMGPNVIVRGEELWQYGTGFHSRHEDVEARRRKTDGVVYRYVQRIDGFVSLDFEALGGRAVTAPVEADGPRLALNLDTAVLGHLRVALLDEGGKAMEGFGLDDCEILRTNATHALVSWKNGADLSALQGRQVRLAFAGERAKLFAFFFVSEDL